VERLQHLERLIRDMLLFARGEALGREPFGICELVAELAQTFEPLARRREVAFVVADESAVAPVVSGNRKALAGALTNLLENALDARRWRPGGRIRSTPAALDGMLHPLWCATTAAAWMRPPSRACSSPSSPPAPTAPGWAWRSRAASPAPTAATSRSIRSPAAAPCSD
jgi:hypothetical protein